MSGGLLSLSCAAETIKSFPQRCVVRLLDIMLVSAWQIVWHNIIYAWRKSWHAIHEIHWTLVG